ncbi:MAG TPA: prepilin peptidase [Vicinamibacterales bacterium]|nr:prepilin peptidase [Vicinamibacterales bacterium]
MNADPIELAIVVFLGLAIGSFLNVVVHRLPRRESLVSPGSRCPSCGYALRAIDNIPVVSYVMLMGRCRRCRTRISLRYPLVELATALIFVLHYFVFGWTPLLAVRLLFAAAMVALFAIDLEHRLLPDAVTLPGIAAGLLASVFLPPGLRDALIGMLLGGGVLWAIGEAYYRFSGVEGMGGGDIKMLAMVGAFLGWQQVLITLVFSSIAGSVIGLIVIAVKRGGMKYALPFGTFLAIAAIVASLYGEPIVGWYTGLYR